MKTLQEIVAGYRAGNRTQGRSMRSRLMAAVIGTGLLGMVGGSFVAGDVHASAGGPVLPSESWEFHGIFGRFNQADLRRGAQVATEVCLSCHSIKYIKFEHLKQIGMTEAEVNALASTAGKSRKDYMTSAMDENAAKESFGTLPPDLSLMTKARKGYENYAYAILNGYLKPEERAVVDRAMEDGKLSDTEVKEVAGVLHVDAKHPDKLLETVKRIQNNENFNKYFPGNFLAMPEPLTAGQVTYADGKEASVRQLSRDVVSFLAWAAEPTMEERKSTGMKVILYLVVLTAMLYAVKRRIWSRIHH
jgi:ubiquinol-cytochrome c reductase cytochrome c1 subunit